MVPQHLLDLIGQRLNDEIEESLTLLPLYRIIRPDRMYTCDCIPRRVNIVVDGKGLITNVHTG